MTDTEKRDKFDKWVKSQWPLTAHMTCDELNKCEDGAGDEREAYWIGYQAALASHPAVDALPQAWQAYSKWPANHDLTLDSRMAKKWQELGYIVTPLYAKPSPQSPASADMRNDADRLDFLDRNKKFNMGWSVASAPRGNLSVQSIIMGGSSIREAIDAAITIQHKKQGNE